MCACDARRDAIVVASGGADARSALGSTAAVRRARRGRHAEMAGAGCCWRPWRAPSVSEGDACMCVYVCVCVCARASERAREERDMRERVIEDEREYVPRDRHLSIDPSDFVRSPLAKAHARDAERSRALCNQGRTRPTEHPAPLSLPPPQIPPASRSSVRTNSRVRTNLSSRCCKAVTTRTLLHR